MTELQEIVSMTKLQEIVSWGVVDKPVCLSVSHKQQPPKSNNLFLLILLAHLTSNPGKKGGGADAKLPRSWLRQKL